jgi:hypothetical protein
MNVLITNLHEDASGLCQQLACDDEPVAKVGARYEWIPSFQVSRNARTCSGCREASYPFPSFTSCLRVLTCQFEPNLTP